MPAVLLAGLFTLGLLGAWLRRSTRKHPVPSTPSDPTVLVGDDSPRGDVVRLAAEVRRALGARFGAAMRARTTEELAADPLLREALGAERLECLTRLLSLADYSKFAPPSDGPSPEPEEGEIAAWKSLLSELNRAEPLPR